MLKLKNYFIIKIYLKSYGLDKEISFSESTQIFKDLMKKITGDYEQKLNLCAIENYLPKVAFYTNQNI